MSLSRRSTYQSNPDIVSRRNTFSGRDDRGEASASSATAGGGRSSSKGIPRSFNLELERFIVENDLDFENSVRRLCWEYGLRRETTEKILKMHKQKQARKFDLRRGAADKKVEIEENRRRKEEQLDHRLRPLSPTKDVLAPVGPPDRPDDNVEYRGPTTDTMFNYVPFDKIDKKGRFERPAQRKWTELQQKFQPTSAWCELEMPPETEGVFAIREGDRQQVLKWPTAQQELVAVPPGTTGVDFDVGGIHQSIEGHRLHGVYRAKVVPCTLQNVVRDSDLPLDVRERLERLRKLEKTHVQPDSFEIRAR